MSRQFLPITFVCLIATTLTWSAEEKKDNPVIINEGSRVIEVRSTAPIPEEITNETQASALSREAAITQGQAELLTYVLNKKTRSGKTLAEAEIPSLDLQGKIRTLIREVRIKKSTWKDKKCTVFLQMNKKPLKTLLKSS